MRTPTIFITENRMRVADMQKETLTRRFRAVVEAIKETQSDIENDNIDAVGNDYKTLLCVFENVTHKKWNDFSSDELDEMMATYNGSHGAFDLLVSTIMLCENELNCDAT